MLRNGREIEDCSSETASAIPSLDPDEMLMLNFDEQRFIRIQSGALALADRIDEVIGECIAKGQQNLFFLGSGGAGILMLPAARLLQTRSTFPVFWDMPAELVLTGSVHLGPRSIVVIPSLS